MSSYPFRMILPVPGYPNYTADDSGQVFRVGSPKPLRPEVHRTRNNKEYHRLTLYAGKVRKHIKVHHIILSTFIGQRPSPTHHASHLNDNGHDNRLINLKWDDPLSNQRSKVRHCKACQHPHSSHDESGQCHERNCNCEGFN